MHNQYYISTYACNLYIENLDTCIVMFTVLDRSYQINNHMETWKQLHLGLVWPGAQSAYNIYSWMWFWGNWAVQE